MRRHGQRILWKTPVGLEAYGAGAPESLTLDPPLKPIDEAIFLLHTAAEIEHALMAQYLYAAYSLKPDRTAWAKSIFATAREEMAHLLTVENLLWYIGGPLNFEREDMPAVSDFYPFKLELEPLTLESLAKYIMAERPETVDPAILPPDLDAEIREKAQADAGGSPVNRVGKLFERLMTVIEETPEAEFLGGGQGLQATADEWGVSLPTITRDENGKIIGVGAGLLVLTASTKKEALDGLLAVAIQGEGAAALTQSANSHFMRFLTIYKQMKTATGPFTNPVPVNPTTHAGAGEASIAYGPSKLLAQFANLRYRLLLAEVHHSLLLPAGDSRALLVSWVFDDMRPILGSAGRLLSQMPRASRDDRSKTAAVPFELPYSLALPAEERARWRMLGMMLDECADRLAQLRAHADFAALDEALYGELSALLDSVAEIDAARREAIRARS